MSIGGLPALNDGNNARAELYTRLIDTYGVQLVISAGNSGPGANTIGDPGLADKVISVGAAISKETWAANYGSVVEKKYQMMPFSSRGPREDGGFTPDPVRAGCRDQHHPDLAAGLPGRRGGLHAAGRLLDAAGHLDGVPAGRGRVARCCCRAAKQKHIELTPATLRTALDLDRRPHQGCAGVRGGRGPHQHRGRLGRRSATAPRAHEYTP